MLIHLTVHDSSEIIRHRQTGCGRLAQLGEHRVRNAGVEGSNPLPSTFTENSSDISL